MSNDSTGPVEDRFVSVGPLRARDVTREALQQSPAFLAEQHFLATCKIAVKLAVRRGELHAEVTLGVDTERRTYQHDDEAPMPVRDGLAFDVARDLGLARDVHAEDRVQRAIGGALRLHWLRIREEVERQASDPTALHKAYRRYGASQRGAAVIAIRARVKDLDDASVASVMGARSAGGRAELRGALAALDDCLERSALGAARAHEVIVDGIVRGVMES